MLRITSRIDPSGIILDLEGKLAGPWVQEVENCWRQIDIQNRRLRVNLRAVTFVDAAGAKLLDSMYRKGAELEAGGCMTRAIVAEIQRGKVHE